MSNFTYLPDELVLKIFTYLDLKDLGRCIEVCKRFRNIFHDEILWYNINMSKKNIPAGFLKHISHNGPRIKVEDLFKIFIFFLL